MTPERKQTVQWLKSSHSGTDGQCVEIAPQRAGVAVRDSKNRRAALEFSRRAWSTFISAVKAEQLDC